MIPQTGAEFIAPAAQCPPAQTSLNGVDYRPAAGTANGSPKSADQREPPQAWHL